MGQSKHHVLLSVLVARHDNMWIAQALEYDFAAQGPTPDAALSALRRTVIGHLRLADEENPFEHVPQAPQIYWDIWNRVAAQQAPRPLPLTPSESGTITPAWMLAAQSNDNHVPN